MWLVASFGFALCAFAALAARDTRLTAAVWPASIRCPSSAVLMTAGLVAIVADVGCALSYDDYDPWMSIIAALCINMIAALIVTFGIGLKSRHG